MNVRANVEVRREPTLVGQTVQRETVVSVSIDIEDARRGDAVVGALDSAWKGARAVIVDTLGQSR